MQRLISALKATFVLSTQNASTKPLASTAFVTLAFKKFSKMVVSTVSRKTLVKGLKKSNKIKRKIIIFSNNGGCSSDAICKSSIVGYKSDVTCQCKSGFTGDGFTCSMLNPCEENNCSKDANCIPFKFAETAADYNCQCKTGFKGNGYICVPDIDPCEIITCSPDASKKRRIDKYGQEVCECHCNQGFSGNGEKCYPVNPCLNHDCDINASCSADPVYRYKCECNSRYEGDGKTCLYKGKELYNQIN